MSAGSAANRPTSWRSDASTSSSSAPATSARSAHASARADVRDFLADGQIGRQLGDVAEPRRAVDVEPARPMEVVPLREVPPLAVEDLHAAVLAISHVDEALAVGGDVVRNIEAPG